MDDTLFSALAGAAPFAVFFLALAFGLFRRPPAARPIRTWVWVVAPPAPPAVPLVARLAGVDQARG